jgi:hypothetical protein
MKKLLLPVAFTTVVHAVLMAAFAGAYHGDPSALVCLGTTYQGREPYEALGVAFNGAGYDGQFYYALARDPWHAQTRGIDAPAYRHKRILYPALAWLLTAGDSQRLRWALPLLNLVAIAGLSALGGLLALRRGASAWWGVLLPLTVSGGLSALRDLTDPFSTFLVCGLLVGWLLRWPWWQVALCATASLLCREQNLPVVGILLLAALWQRRKWESAALTGAITVWILWIGIVWIMYGVSPFTVGDRLLNWPLVGMVEGIGVALTTGSAAWRALTLLALVILVVQVPLVVVLLRHRLDPALGGVLLVGVALFLVGGAALYSDFWANQRVFAVLPLAVWLGCVQVRQWRLLVPLAAPGLIMLVVVAHAWVKPTALREAEGMPAGGVRVVVVK